MFWLSLYFMFRSLKLKLYVERSNFLPLLLVSCSYNFSCYYLLLLTTCANDYMDQGIAVSYYLLVLIFSNCENLKRSQRFSLLHCFSYCALAPTVLAGQIEPFLFEALYVSGPLMYTLHFNLFIGNCCHSSFFFFFWYYKNKGIIHTQG